MAGPMCHFIGGAENVRQTRDVLKDRGVTAKISRDNDRVHLFIDPASSPRDAIESVASSFGSSWTHCAGCHRCETFPKQSSKGAPKYAVYPPLILLPTGSALAGVDDLASNLLAQFPQCTHVAVNRPIKTDDPVRKPQIIPIVGDFGSFDESSQPSRESLDAAFWATSVQNGIFQTWAPMYTMFSRGNITEKKRVLTDFRSQAEIKASTVVDLYCGIGYFTLPYAMQQPKIVYCWEINWWSIEGLLRAAKVNKLNARLVHRSEPYVARPDDKIVIFAEDNQHALDRLAELDLSHLSHINMGLLPDAHAGVPVALGMCAEASMDHVMVHLHENVRSDDITEWSDKFSKEIGDCLHIEKIKKYSPGVFHVCGDFEYRTSNNNRQKEKSSEY